MRKEGSREFQITNGAERMFDKLECGIELPEYEDVVDMERVRQLREVLLDETTDMLVREINLVETLVANYEYLKANVNRRFAESEQDFLEESEGSIEYLAQMSTEAGYKSFERIVTDPLIERFREASKQYTTFYSKDPQMSKHPDKVRSWDQDGEVISKWLAGVSEFKEDLWEKYFSDISEVAIKNARLKAKK